MTVVLGVRKPEGVYLAADSASSAGWTRCERRDEKIFQFECGAFGFTTSYRMGQLLYVELKDILKVSPYAKGEAFDWGVSELIPRLRTALSEGGWSSKDKEVEKGGQFLIATDLGDLIAVDPDFQIILVDSALALGCGEELALGAYSALEGTGETKRNIERALAVSERWCAGVRSPFHLHFVPVQRGAQHG